MRGWFSDPHRHALAARGVRTSFTPKGFKKSLQRVGYTSLEEARRAVVQAHMTPEEVLDWNIETTYSASPDDAFSYRDDEIWTLDEVAVGDQQLFIDEALGGRWFHAWKPTTHLIPAIKKGEKITIYRASDVGDIIPGSYISESEEYAREHGERSIGEEYPWKIYSLEAYPDELMWYGDPHEFLFIPRSPERWLEIARERVKDIPFEVQLELIGLGGGP